MKSAVLKIFCFFLIFAVITVMSGCDSLVSGIGTPSEPENDAGGDVTGETPEGNPEDKPENKPSEGEKPEDTPEENPEENTGDTGYSSGLEFELNEDGESYKVISLGTETGETVSIPPEYSGKPVTAIANYAFSSDVLKIVKIPASITSIGVSVFSSCKALEDIIVAEDNPVYYSKDGCLIHTETRTLVRGCKNSTVPSDGSVTVIGFSAFSNHDGFGELVIPDGITKIEGSAFYNCNNLTSVTIPASVEYIEKNAFSLCTDLVTVTFKENSVLSSLGEYSFAQCPNIIEITLPSSLKTIEKYAFWMNDSLKSVTFGEESLIETIKTSVFEDCKGLETVNFGKAAYLKTIGIAAFYGCISLEEITIPASVTIIDQHLFYGCTKLKTVRLLGEVTDIGAYSFNGCSKLENIYYISTVSEWQALPKGEKWDYEASSNYTVVCSDGQFNK